MIALIPEKSLFMSMNAQGKPVLSAQLVCDTSAELAGVTEVDGSVCAFGSVALAVTEAEICVLSSSGSWYKMSDGTEIAVPDDDTDDNEEGEGGEE